MLKIKLNEDKEIVNTIKQGLKENNGYCPCKIIKNEDTKCMCKEFREQLTPGPCHCMLYIKYREE